MTSSLVRNLIERHVQAVGLPLYEGVSAGVDQALFSMGRLSPLDYPWLLSGHARAAMRDHWRRNLEGGGSGWIVAGRPQLMGETLLVNRQHRVELRLLKENRRIHPGGVPTAGRGETRRQAWQEPLPGLSFTAEGDERLDRTAGCLLLWSLGFDSNAPIISVRVVHTVGPGRYGHRVPIDMSFSINPQGQMFENLGFSGDPQNEDLFPTISEEENEGGLGM